MDTAWDVQSGSQFTVYPCEAVLDPVGRGVQFAGRVLNESLATHKSMAPYMASSIIYPSKTFKLGCFHRFSQSITQNRKQVTKHLVLLLSPSL